MSFKDATILPIWKVRFQCTLVPKTRVPATNGQDSRENASSKFQSSRTIHGLLWTFRRRVLWKELKIFFSYFLLTRRTRRYSWCECGRHEEFSRWKTCRLIWNRLSAIADGKILMSAPEIVWLRVFLSLHFNMDVYFGAGSVILMMKTSPKKTGLFSS